LTPTAGKVHPDDMRYYYLQADNTPGGPESLESLVAMVASGQITLATLVVPVGGEDWTPLARVLSFYYADAQGQPAGPVPFSELSRMQQVQALAADAWVLPVGATQWVALKGVLTSGGAAIAETVAPVRPVQGGAQPARGGTGPVRGATGAVRAAGGDNPYAAPKTQVRKVIVHHPTGGMNRLQYFLGGIGISVVTMGLLALVAMPLLKGLMEIQGFGAEAQEQSKAVFKSVGNNVLMAAGGIYLVSIIVSIWFMVLRNRNIGWSWPFIFFMLVPLANVWYGFALMAYPPGYARHRRFDTVTKVLLGVIVGLVVLMIGIVAFAASRASKLQSELNKPATIEELQRTLEEAARNKTPANP
jgi:uncharacterized membrane protein YhaH (DUF805 family)